MGRLIDADANREDFKKVVFRILLDWSATTREKFNMIMTAFDSMPIAYDVEKVVAELEEASTCDDIDDAFYIREYKAIEIVRKGGVNE